jgi:hypothetical protein
MRRLLLFLVVGVIGVALLLSGLVWDAVLHADDPGLAAREGLFTFSNPGHLLLALGIALTSAGLIGATDAALSLRAGRPWGRGGPRLAAAALCTLVVSGAAVTGTWATRAGHDHDDRQKASSASEADGHSHVAGGHATAGPTADQQAAADTLRADTRRATVKWASVDAARRDGYRAITPVFDGIQHWHNDRFHTDGKVLDPDAPEELVYASTTRGLVLVAAMYLMPTVGEPGPQVGGPLTVWHDHTDLCFTIEGRVVGFHRPPTLTCPAGSATARTPEMLHVWVVDNPAGPFAPEMTPAALVAIAEGRSG